MNLRKYQQEAVAAAIEQMEEHGSTMIVAATGAGKTIMLGHVAKHYISKGRVLVIAHREELIRQNADKIGRITGTGPDIEMAGEWADAPDIYRDEPARIIVSTVQTQVSGFGGKGRMTRFNPMDFYLVIVDEMHHICAPSYRKLIAHYQQNPNCHLLGVTATPDRADKLALGAIVKTVAYEYPIYRAIEEGYLVPVQQHAVHVKDMDFSRCRTTHGDLNQGDLADEMGKFLHEVADPSFKISAGRKMLVFAPSVAMAERLAEVYNRHEPECARFLSGTTPDEVRAETLLEFKRGKFRILVNCALFLEGFDEPTIEVIANARPTKSRALYAQMIGRGTRALEGVVDGKDSDAERIASIAASGKPTLIMIDFVGCAGRHAMIGPIDVLGGNYDLPDIDAAKAVAKPGAPIDVQALLAKTKADRLARFEAERLRKLEVEQRRKGIVGRAKYETREVAAFEHGQSADAMRSIQRGPPPATEKQIRYLKFLGYCGETPKSVKHAGALISAMKDGSRVAGSPKEEIEMDRALDRAIASDAEPYWKTLLRKAGKDPTLPFEQAMPIINALRTGT